jgi:hypothetical protein
MIRTGRPEDTDMGRTRTQEVEGRVERGVVVFDPPTSLPDGTRVSVRPIGRPSADPKRRARTLYDILKPVIGKARNLPPDASVNHDHYLYGVPKRR